MNNLDAAAVARIRANHDTYRAKFAARELEPGDYPSWAGLFEVNIEELLEIVERLTRPEVDRLERELSAAYAGKHEAGA